eukprot:COSAG02_NODE_95_length_37416_cov_60.512742_35_plen_583_part_00
MGGMTEAQRKHLAEAENKKRLGNEHYKRYDFTHENEDMRWAVRRYTEALRELDTLTGKPLLDKKGWTPPVAEQQVGDAAAADVGEDEDEDDVLELGADGTFNAVEHDKSKPAVPSQPKEPPVMVAVGKDTAVPTEIAVENLDEEQLEARVKELRISCLLNRAAAHLKCKGYGGNDGAEKDCTTVLQQLDPKNAKALFRRGQARHSMRCFAEAVGDLQQAATLAPKDRGVAKALKQSKLELEKQEKSKKLWNPSEQERRAKAAADERDVIERLTAADTIARKEHGVEKWEAMSDMDKRRIVLEIAVREELERTAPKTVRQRDGDLSLGTDASAKMDAARSGARAAAAAAGAAAEPEPSPSPPVEDSWSAFWKDDKVAEREAAEKARLDAARKLEAAAELAMRKKFSEAQDKMRQEDEAAAAVARQARRDNLEAKAAATREAALAHKAGNGTGNSPAQQTSGVKFARGFLSAPQKSAEPQQPTTEGSQDALSVQPEPEHSQKQQQEAAATLTAALTAAASQGSGSGGGSTSSGGAGSTSGQVWAHCAVPPLHKCRAHYGRKWASMPAETKRLAITAAEEGTPLP